MSFARKRRVETLIKQYRALLILSKSIGPDAKHKLDRLLEQLPTVTAKQLIQVEHFHKAQLKEVSTMVGLQMPLSEVVAIVEEAERNLPQHLYIAKFAIDRKFTGFAARAKNWNSFSPHSTIAFDVSCKSEPSAFEWRLLEASLFEDLAMLWNQAADHHVTTAENKIAFKHFHVLTRSVTRAAYALLEGYLNGVAIDILITRADLKPNEVELVDERRDDGRFAPVTLRNKILQYHRIALKREHPAIQENNCQDMRTVLKFERDLRDALMHPAPRLDIGQERSREQRYYDISLDDTRTIIDAVVGLIRRVDSELNGLFGHASLWLFDRDDTDRYPTKTFL